MQIFVNFIEGLNSPVYSAPPCSMWNSGCAVERGYNREVFHCYKSDAVDVWQNLCKIMCLLVVRVCCHQATHLSVEISWLLCHAP